MNNTCILYPQFFDWYLLYQWIWLILKNVSLLDRIWSLWLVRFAHSPPNIIFWLGRLIFSVSINSLPDNIYISWRSVLLEETGVPWDNHRTAASHWQTLSQNLVHLTLSVSRTHNISDDRHRFMRYFSYSRTTHSWSQYNGHVDNIQFSFNVLITSKHFELSKTSDNFVTKINFISSQQWFYE